MTTTRNRLAQEAALRIVADLMILNAALLVGLVSRYFAFAYTKPPRIAILYPYLYSFWALSIIGIAIFATMGFYTRGRVYKGRYKAAMVAEGSTLAFLIFGFVGYVLPHVGRVPRPALLMSWGMATGALLGARFWVALWNRISESPDRRSALAAPAVQGGRDRILVIGGAGYIGSALLPKLLDAGYRVRLLDCFLYGYDPIAVVRDHPNLEIVPADFRRLDVVVRAVRGVHSVVHLGAIVGDPACALDEDLTIETNLLATRTIAEITMAEGVRRFVFASTCSVYGASDQYLDEHSTLNPVSLYARSKVACERVLLGMKTNSFLPIILRFGTIYGLSGRTRFDLVVNLLTAKAIVDGVITVYGKDQWRPFLHVDDAALALFRALEAPATAVSETIFNVGSDEQNHTLGDVGRMIHSFVPQADLQYLAQDGDRRNYRVNFSRISRCLHFNPEWTLEMGIDQVLQAIRTGRVVDYKDPRYSNARFLSEEIGPASLRLPPREVEVRELLETRNVVPVLAER